MWFDSNLIMIVVIWIIILTLMVAVVKALIANPEAPYPKVIFQLFLYYSGYVMPLYAIVFGVWWFVVASMPLWVLVAGLFGISAYFYAVMVEPNRLKITHHRISLGVDKPVKIAVLADIHVGLFSGKQRQLVKLVKSINQMDVDLVVVAGDWTYEPGADIVGKMMVLKALNKPCYSVMGNHDEQFPGPDLVVELREALAALSIEDIEGKNIDLPAINLIGVGDLWASKADFAHLDQAEIDDKPCVVLAHNPDTITYLPKNRFATPVLMISGHTHGGQIYIPKLTPYLFKKATKTGYLKGLYYHKSTESQVFVTSGTGMVYLPFRINQPPCIDVITLV